MPARSVSPLPAIFIAFLVATSLPISGCGRDSRHETKASDSGPLLIAAASDLRPAFTELAKRYEARSGVKVTLTFGASGQLAQQLENGAPYALFASASTDYVDQVLDSGRGDRATRAVYAYGRLAVWSPKRAYRFDQLTGSGVEHVAVADPTHAPYGKAAVGALKAAGIYARVKPKLVYGDNVGATQQLAASVNAYVAVIARSLALSSGGHLTPVPDDLYEPLAQGLVVTGAGADAGHARAFIALLESPEGQGVLLKDGFVLPGNASPVASPGS